MLTFVFLLTAFQIKMTHKPIFGGYNKQLRKHICVNVEGVKKCSVCNAVK